MYVRSAALQSADAKQAPQSLPMCEFEKAANSYRVL
jgi:hypothetical protein